MLVCEEHYTRFVNLDEHLLEHRLQWVKADKIAHHKVKVQTFFTGRALRRYFIVHVEQNSESSAPHEVTEVVRTQLAR